MSYSKKSSTQERLSKYFEFISDVLKNEKAIFTNKCVKINEITKIKTLNNIRIINRIGTGSIGGEAYVGCYPHPGNCKNKLALKIIPINKRRDLPYIKKFFEKDKIDIRKVFNDKYSLNFSNVISEIFFMELVGTLVRENICPNLPLYYGGFVCDNCEYSNKKLKSSNKNCFILPNELADGDLKSIIEKAKVSVTTMRFIFFQIFMGIYAMKKYFGICHNDLHYGNVLFTKVDKSLIFRYKIQGNAVYIPTNGYLITLWDFGYASIPGKITNPYIGISDKINDVVDFGRIISMISKSNKYHNLYKTLWDMLSESSDMEQFIKFYIFYLSKYTEDIEATDNIETFKVDKDLTMIPLFQKYILDSKSSHLFSRSQIPKFIAKTTESSSKNVKKKSLSSPRVIEMDVVTPSPRKSVPMDIVSPSPKKPVPPSPKK